MFGWLKLWLGRAAPARRTPASAVPQIAVQGLPVTFGEPAAPKQRVERHVMRMIRLIDHVAKPLPAEVIAGAQAEFEQRRRILAAAGYEVPANVGGLERLLEQIREG